MIIFAGFIQIDDGFGRKANRLDERKNNKSFFPSLSFAQKVL